MKLAGFPLFVADDDQLLQEIDTLVISGHRSLIVTANVDQAIDLGRNVDLWNAYKDASIRTLDGMPLVWISRLLGARGVNRQTGADLLTKCVFASFERGWKIAIVGGEPPVNAAAVEKLRSDYPLADIVGIDIPYSQNFQTAEMQNVLNELSDAEPDVVFICLGSPKQERFVMELRSQLPPAVYVGAGAAVDFAAGVRRRAPRLVQLAGLEWTWRLLQEPRRLGHRYLIKGSGIGKILQNSISRKR